MTKGKVIGRKRISTYILAAIFVGLSVIFCALQLVVNSSTAALREPLPDYKEKYCAEFDTEAPGIELTGEPEIYIRAGGTYEEPGASVLEYCQADDVSISATTVDTSTPGEYSVVYSAKDARGNMAEVTRKVYVLPASSGTVYLTFDDGPGPYTDKLLDVLAKYNVKATFFVTGAGSDDTLRREYNEGHAIGLHTLSHDYSYIYSSVDNFFADLYAVQNRVKNATGYTSTLIRFPGGSSNMISAYYDGGAHIMSRLVPEVTARGFSYFDWNISSGDAGGTTSTDEVVSNVTSHLFVDGKSVVLQHDIKDFSVEAVERIIQYGLANGFTFSRLETDSFGAHHGINN